MKKDNPTPPLAAYLARLLERLSAQSAPELTHIVADLIQANAEGHVCLPLPEIAGGREKLLATGMVGQPGEFRPLILDEANRLYLHRLWQQEKTVGDALLTRLQATPLVVDETRLLEGLALYFGAEPENRQRLAAETAVRERFTMISGGPGTGKTRTVLAILALLIGQSLERPPRLALVAPTGKAAARLRDSMQAVATSLALPEAVQASLPTEAQTIHRLLSGQRFAQKRANRHATFLPLDGIIVDEASMVDLGLLAHLLQAMPPLARVILLGDRHQLASVEAGAAFGDLAKAGATSRLAKNVVELRKSYRFTETSGIFRLSQAVQAGAADEVLEILRAELLPDVAGVEYARPSELAAVVEREIAPHFQQILAGTDPVHALAGLDQCRILCALRRGPFGVAGLNALMLRLLEEKGAIHPSGEWFAGRPVIITENDYEQRLFNGETGLCLPDPDAAGQLRIFFHGENPGSVRRFSPSSLPPHETAFALTVHRSQGSEFDRVLVVLPSQDAPVLSRELLYTAITRARRQVILAYQAEVLKLAVLHQVSRVSGLAEKYLLSS